LTDLAALDYPALFTLLVDNGGGEGEAWPPVPGLEVIAPGGNLGYCRAVNLGVERALARGAAHVLLLNNDVRFAPDMLAPLVAALEGEEQAGSAGPRILDPQGRIWCTGGFFRVGPNVTRLRGQGRRGEQLYPTPGWVDYLPGACVLHRGEALRRAGFLEESYWMYMEDVDLALEMRAQGYRALYVPWSRAVHAPSTSSGGGHSAWRKYCTALNSVRFLRRHGTFPRWLNFWVCDVAGLPLALLGWIARGAGTAPARAKARGILHGLAGRRVGPEGAP
jgi:GT2 family glycosyltransferase